MARDVPAALGTLVFICSVGVSSHPLCPPQIGDCAEDGCLVCEEGTQAACCGSGSAPPGTSGGQVPTVLEGSRGTRATEEAVLASQVCDVLVRSPPLLLC